MTLTKTLSFQLDIQTKNGESRLLESRQEARKAYNRTIELAKQGTDWNKIPDIIKQEVDLVVNTTQRIVEKALEAMENYYDFDDYNLPSHNKDSPYPLRSNYTEGYNLFLSGDAIQFRISGKPYKPVKGTLEGSKRDIELVRKGLENDRWKLGTSEVIKKNGNYELHVNITDTETEVRDSSTSQTLIGVDINEDNVALTAVSENGVEDSIVIEFPEVKSERHKYHTIRNRVQESEKYSTYNAISNKEQRFVRDRVHKLSRTIVDWASQFDPPCIVFEDLKDMRDEINYGKRMNRRLHAMPFGLIQKYTTYKANFVGIPVVKINPEYTSQECVNCGHKSKSNRHKKRFKCQECEYQDHSDRNASINIAERGVKEYVSWNVPSLNNPPVCRTVRRKASGIVDVPTATKSNQKDLSNATLSVLTAGRSSGVKPRSSSR
jgi:putative transposase